MPVLKSGLLAMGAVIALGALTSCATLDQDECRSVNWTTLGREDGAEGRASSHIQRHRDACDRYKLPVDEQSWVGGWEEGIRVYCTPANGLNQGRMGRTYANSCPLDLKTGFESAYYVSKRLYDAEAEVNQVRSEIESLIRSEGAAKTREEAQRVRMEISFKRSALFSAENRVFDAQRDYDRYLREVRS